jgi:hypothetical protein
MAGIIVVRPNAQWSAASWLFYWVIRDLSTTVRDTATVGKLQGIEREHLPGLRLSDLPDGPRREVLTALCRSIVDHGARSLPVDLPNRNDILNHLQELADIACRDSQLPPGAVT